MDCQHYPCHFPDQDCTFCFCPFYPCRDPRTGGRGEEWSCSGCTAVHRPEAADLILQGLMDNEELPAIWRRLVSWL